MNELTEHLRTLLDAATPGPWTFTDVDPEFADVEICSVDGTYVGQTSYDTLSGTTRNSINDAALIVAVRNALPDLLEIIEAGEQEADDE